MLQSSNVYVLAADADVHSARLDLRKLLRDAARATINMPLPVEKSAEARRVHEEGHLRDADAAVVLWASEDVAWVEAQLHRLRNWKTLGRQAAFNILALFVIGPDSGEKDEDLLAPDELRIDARQDLAGGLMLLGRALASSTQ